MDQINSKEDLISYFKQGCKTENQTNIGVEHEKFIFEKNFNRRINFQTVSKIFSFLTKFGWEPLKENNNIVALSRNEQSITLEPGNQIELSGAQLNSIHLACEESYKFLSELKQACESLDLKMMSVGYDPFSTLQNVPKTPKQRYEVMTEVMPKNGKLSLEMMYQTCGTQINLDYTSENNFIKKFKLSSFLVPLSVAIFANSPIKENKSTGYFSYRSKVWQHTSRAGLPRIFLEEMDFEKYTDMDNCFGVVGDIIGAFAIVFEKNRITFRTVRSLLENMKYNRYELLEFINRINNESIAKFTLVDLDFDNIWIELSYLQEYNKDSFDYFLDKLTAVMLTDIENWEKFVVDDEWVMPRA